MNQMIELTTNETITLAQHAEAIRLLGKRVVRDVIEIGARLVDAKGKAGHGNWLPWLEREFGWSDDTAERFMSLHRLQGQIPQIAEYDLPVSGLYMLAAPSTPEEVREVVVEKAKNGESISVAEVKRMIDEATKKQKQELTEKLDAQRASDHAKAEERIAKLQDAASSREAKLEERRANDLAKAEERIAKLQELANSREAKLREKVEGMISMEEVEAQVEKSIAPVMKQLERAKKELERLQKPTPKRADKKGLESTGLAYALEHMNEACLKLTPDQIIEHQRFVTEATGQTMKAGLAEKIANARRVVSWLNRFIDAAKEL